MRSPEEIKKYKERDRKEYFKAIAEKITSGDADDELIQYLEKNYVLFKVTNYRIARKITKEINNE